MAAWSRTAFRRPMVVPNSDTTGRSRAIAPHGFESFLKSAVWRAPLLIEPTDVRPEIHAAEPTLTIV